ncbi:GDSL esterase/lipase At5g03980-like [Silene latifolia]|uniref:GDSL esterase/lipase At5g03980-like n=1 Tax=Silene latifolia TaxID=37657 RepID=UPI003D76D15D
MSTPFLFSSSFILAVLFSSFASQCLSSTFADDNLIRSVSSDGGRLHDHHHFPRLPVEAIYQFGDSLADTGNLMRINPSLNCANWPYGESYFDKPTGRCSDGLLMIDYFAKFLNLPFIDEYLNEDGKFEHGVNFAVGGATALNVSVLKDKYDVSADNNYTLSVQLSWFKSHIHSFYPDASERRRKLDKSLFLMGEIGGNDYNFALYQGKTLSDAHKMVPDVIKAITNAVKKIIDLGATQIAIPGNFPIGCVPIYLTLFKTNDSDKYDKRDCLKEYNKLAKFHNDKLKDAIEDLEESYPDISIEYMDYYGAFREIIRHPTEFGFDKNTVQEACCGVDDNGYNVTFGVDCGTEGVPVCENPQEHVSWDGTHLTQQAYHGIAKQLMKSNDGVRNTKIWENLRFVGICLFFIWVF